MDGTAVVFLISLFASLFLAVRALRSHGLSVANTAWMAVGWVLIISVLAVLVVRFGL